MGSSPSNSPEILYAANMQQADICAELQLQENQDGLWVNKAQTLLLFPVGGFLPWQKADADVTFFWRGGAPLAFSFSPDGHDAAAVHLGPKPELHQQPDHALAANVWHTGESLGNWTLLERQGTGQIEKAAADWFPTPRHMQGHA